MARTDMASRVISAAREGVYAALVDEEAPAAWLPPEGMHGRLERFDPRPGRGLRLRRPGLPGTMTMTWELSEVENGTRVEIRADAVPAGIS